MRKSSASRNRRVGFILVSVWCTLSLAQPAAGSPNAQHIDGLQVPQSDDPAGSHSVAGGPYPSSGISLISQLDLASFPDAQTRGADLWGYTSPSGRRYALMCFTKGVAFVEVTDPNTPTVVDYVDGGGVDQTWRDVKTYQHYAYVVSDGNGVGLQVIDMSTIDAGSVTWVNTVTEFGLQTAHNVVVNEDSGFLYVVGGNLASGGLVAIDLNSDPADPSIVGEWDDFYCHDAQAVTYHAGPYAGSEIAFCFSEDNGVRIVDVTDKANMVERSSVIYPNIAYCHQGWLDVDRKHLYVNDELDEFFGNVATTTTYIINVEDLDNPFFVSSFTTGLPSTDHNLFIRGRYLYCANYTTGLHVFDIIDVNNPQHVGFFDTHPESDAVDINFPGAWAPYVGFDAPLVLVADRERGLFLLDASEIIETGDAVPATSTWGWMCLLLLVLVTATLNYRGLGAVRVAR